MTHERLMAVWRAPNGAEVGRVSQGVALDPATRRPVAVYFAQSVGLPREGCPRFTCAKSKVEAALAAAGIQASGALV